MDSIVVKLLREHSGQEILDAFRAAATFQETPTRKWGTHRVVSSTGQGYFAAPAHLGRSRLFRRRSVWKTDLGTLIDLCSVEAGGRYAEVKMTLTHVAPAPKWYQRPLVSEVIHDPDDERFKGLRPAYDRIIRELLRRLD